MDKEFREKRTSMTRRFFKQKTKEEIEQERVVQLGILTRLYEQADTVLSGNKIQIQIEDVGGAPARTDGNSIFFNESQILSLDIETISNLTGLNYHELAHYLYSPRQGTPIVKEVMLKGWLVAFNALEDQRIETLLLGRYRAIAPFFIGMTVRWLNVNTNNLHYISMRGRRYLPRELREAYRDAFPLPHLLPVIAEIVDEYRLLAFPQGYKRGLELIERYHNEVIKPLGIEDPYSPENQNSCNSRSPIVNGRPETGVSQVKDSKRAVKVGTPEGTMPDPADFPDPDDGTGNGSGKGKTGTKEGDGVGAANSDNRLDVTPESIQAALDKRAQAEKAAIRAYGTDRAKSIGGVPKNITELLNRISAGVAQDPMVLADTKNKQKVLRGGDGKHLEAIPKGRYTMTSVPMDAVAAAKRFARELEKLREDTEPTWERETASGRLNVPRVIRGCEMDQAFDRWDNGSDGTDIEAVMLVDRSGSMSYDSNDLKASIACWVIKKSLEAVNALSTVYSFDGQAEIVYTRSEKVDKSNFKFIYGSGGTDPEEALKEAEKLFISSRKKNKILFLITDGDFSARENDKIIDRLNRRGILTVLILISEDAKNKSHEAKRSTAERYRHKASLFGEVAKAEELFPFAKKIVEESINRRR